MGTSKAHVTSVLNLLPMGRSPAIVLSLRGLKEKEEYSLRFQVARA